MDSLNELIPKDPGVSSILIDSESLGVASNKHSADAIVLEQLFTNDSAEKVDLNFEDLYKSLSITQQKVVSALNTMLADELPDGIQSVDSSYANPEFAADNIVSSITAFFGIYQKQNPNASADELLNGFMKQVKSGVEQGYGEAFSALDGIGAFELEGIQAGVEQTKGLIEQKLAEYEAKMKVQLGIEEPSVEAQTASSTRDEILKQAGSASVDLQA